MHKGPLSECGDDERDWFPQRHVCQPTMQLRAAERLYGLLHEQQPYHDGTFERWAKDPSRDFPFHYLDGVSVWMASEEIAPDDDFLGGRPLSEQAEGDQPEAAE